MSPFMLTAAELLSGAVATWLVMSPVLQMFPSETLIKARNGDKEAMHGFTTLAEMCEKCNGFAEVFPEHKFEIVAILQDADHVVGMTVSHAQLGACGVG